MPFHDNASHDGLNGRGVVAATSATGANAQQ